MSLDGLAEQGFGVTEPVNGRDIEEIDAAINCGLDRPDGLNRIRVTPVV
jgi:hypothetical protein